MIKNRIKKSKLYFKLKGLYNKYERLLLPGMLIVGVAVDFITFKSIKISTAFLILFIYVIISGATIAFINVYDSNEDEKHNTVTKYLRLVAPLLMQFTFGALLSASLIFYFFSGTISVSWPILIVIALLMVANDVFRHYYLKPSIQMAVYYFILFSISTLIFPFLFNSISVLVFLFSGIFSLAIIYFYIELLSRKVDHIKRKKFAISIFVTVILVGMNSLYFLNIIPPIPLSLRDAGVYHTLARSGGDYILSKEKESIIEKLLPGQTVHIVSGETLYIFSSVFAPADLSTRIVHHWQYFDNNKKEWVTRSKPSFNISGGRDKGYRGFSFSNKVIQGRWRVDVETERGQILGRISFFVELMEEKTELEEIIK